MANAYINIYKNNPTEDATDGTAVSTDGMLTAPISFVLDASQNESQTLKLAVRTEDGYIATDVTVADNNDTNDRLKLCLTEDGTFTDSITFPDTITAVNTIFYAQAGSSSTETPQTDTSANFVVSAVIVSV